MGGGEVYENLGGWLAFALALISASGADAAAWPQKPGHTEVIVGVEPGAANRAFDAKGAIGASLPKWDQTDAFAYIDRGVTARLSLTTKLNFKAYDTGDTHFSGLSSVEFGGRYALHDAEDYSLSAGLSLEGLGRGRRNDFDDLFGRQGTDVDFRVYYGKNLRLAHTNAFLDLQAARKLRQYNHDQWRVDATLGVKPSSHWMALLQAFAGRTDRQAGYETEWLNGEFSLARSFGQKQQTVVQVGLRRTLAGRNVPQVTALTMSLWRRY